MMWNGHDFAKKIKRIIVQLSRFDCQDIKCCSNATHPFVTAARPFILSALAFKSLFIVRSHGNSHALVKHDCEISLLAKL